MSDIEYKEKQEKLKEQYNEFVNGKVEELGAEGFMEFWMNNLNDSINKLDNPTDDIENYFKNLDPLEYTKDPQKLITDIQNELKRQKEEYERAFKNYRESIEKFSVEYYEDKKKAKKKDSNIIKLNSILPKKYIIPNTNISNKLPGVVFGEQFFSIKVGEQKGKDILTLININYDNKNIDLPSNFTAYDRTVLNACISLYEADNECFTLDMVYRCMNGLTDKEKPSPQQKGAITKSIDKMRRLFCTIDFKEESLKRGYKVDKFKIEDNILNAKKIDIEAGGNTVTGYQFNSKPVLYQYAQHSKQIISIPVKLLNTKEVLRATDEVIIIREYLIRCIENMKNSNRNHNIRYDGIYEELGLEVNKTQSFIDKSKKLKSSIKKILDYWKSENYIKNYKEYKKDGSRAYTGIEIIY